MPGQRKGEVKGDVKGSETGGAGADRRGVRCGSKCVWNTFADRKYAQQRFEVRFESRVVAGVPAAGGLVGPVVILIAPPPAEQDRQLLAERCNSTHSAC